MKAIFTLLCALTLGAVFSVQAQAHPKGHAISASHSVAPVALQPEVIATFMSQGESVTAWNEHKRGFFGFELIQFRNERGRVIGSWWTSRGWCYTAAAYADQACHSQRGYIQLFEARLRSETAPGGTSIETSSTEFCDHYSKLEYTISGDTSGVCKYGT